MSARKSAGRGHRQRRCAVAARQLLEQLGGGVDLRTSAQRGGILERQSSEVLLKPRQVLLVHIRGSGHVDIGMVAMARSIIEPARPRPITPMRICYAAYRTACAFTGDTICSAIRCR